ncbi:MAG: YraN family protein [Actinobacteria bacterium]|nr:YraN family protein [Actinomycetota bacterium]
MRQRPNQRLGTAGEDLAAAYLRERGYRIVARNWRPHGAQLRGEVDIVAVRADVLCFVEVKTRRGERFGGPLEAVTWRKQARVRALATAYLQHAGAGRWVVRFDVIGVVTRAGQAPAVVHVPAAF